MLVELPAVYVVTSTAGPEGECHEVVAAYPDAGEAVACAEAMEDRTRADVSYSVTRVALGSRFDPAALDPARFVATPRPISPIHSVGLLARGTPGDPTLRRRCLCTNFEPPPGG